MVGQGWFPVSTRSGKVASMGGPCSLAWPRVREGVGLQREQQKRQGTQCPGGGRHFDSGNCF